MTRSSDIAAFLENARWGGATAVPLAGDASARRYVRLTQPDGTRGVLMDAPHATGETTEPFVRIARHLINSGFTAPDIWAWDEPAGLILMEDLGDDLITQICETNPAQEVSLYQDIARLLAALHTQPLPDWAKPYGPAQMGPMIAPFFDHYAPMSAVDTGDLVAAMTTALNRHTPQSNVLILRDFHAENLLWLPDRAGNKQFGLLDFQDALAGHPVYDLASLLQDARRDVSTEAGRAATTAFCDATGRTQTDVATALAVQGAQRNMRILGIFARLTASGKPKYAPLQSRVRAHLNACLAHPANRDVSAILTRTLPDMGPWTT